MAITISSAFGIHEVSFGGDGPCRDRIQITEVQRRPENPASDLEIENRVLRLLLYDLKNGEASLDKL